MAGEGRPIQFRVLGPPEIVVDGRALTIGSVQQRAILLTLLLERNSPVSSDRLVDVVWGEDPPASAASTLRGLIWRLRQRLLSVEIAGRNEGYLLVAEDDCVDVRRFDHLVAQARAATVDGRPEAAADTLEEALALWRGPAFGELASWPFAQAEAARLDEARLSAVEDLAEAELALGRVPAAIERLEPLVRQWPLRERAVGHLIVGLYRAGRQADALAAYQTLRNTLAEELGLDPTPALRDLEAAVLRQSEELLGATPAASCPGRPAVVFDDTAVFLFTDIEASTRAWEGDGAAMGSDLAHHDALLTEAFTAWDGEIFAHTGDGLCVAFPTAAAAIGAALDGQRALRNATWRQAAPPRVRMAVHAGAAQRRGANWFGPTLNRTARLLGLADGGQVLCSQAAAGLAWDLLPDPIGLIDTGEADLPDLTRPERVYQVTHPDLPVVARPARRPPPTQTHDNLPVLLTPFVGRIGEVEEITEMAGTARLVTLVGPGGAGKTRLSLEVAGRIRDRFPDGVWLVDLAPVSDATGVALAVAAGVGLLASELTKPGDDPLAVLVERLRGRQLLIVLDNCEQVIDAAATAAQALLGASTGLTILATSREPLAVSGEAVFAVPSLSLPPTGSEAGPEVDHLLTFDAVALFCARAHDADRHFSLSEANAESVLRICRRLDGLPLALEIAAARARILGTKELADRLDDRFAALGAGSRSAPARHQTLRAAIDWSHDLLSPAEQAVLHRLAVFPATFDLDAAGAVAGEDTVEIFLRLVDKSLVAVAADEPSIRYQLSESVRAYAAERLAGTGRTADAQRAHRDAFLAITQAMVADGERWLWAERFRRLDADYENFVAALEWSWANGELEATVWICAAFMQYWFWTGHPEACEWAERAAAVPVSSPELLRPLVLVMGGLSVLLRNFGNAADGRAEALVAESIELAERSDDVFVTAWCHIRAADLAIAKGELDDARRSVQRAAVLLRSVGSPVGQSGCEWFLGLIAMASGDLEEADRAFHAALRVFTTLPHDYMVTHTLAGGAVLRAHFGDPDAARLGAEAIAAARQFPVPQILAMALARAAGAALLLGRPADARPLIAELIDILRRLGARRWVAEGHELTAILLGAEDPETAAVALGAADRLRRDLGEPPGPSFLLREALERVTEDVRAAFGPEDFSTLHERGAQMPTDEALRFMSDRLNRKGERWVTASG